MNSVPLVSIVIPAYNSRFFQKALHSAIAQNYPNIEVIVCDDSRGDDIREIVERLTVGCEVPLRYMRNSQRLGFTGNLLTCLEEASGEYIKFLCDDDLLFPACVKMQAEVLIEHADVTMAFAQRFLWDADDIQLPTRLENTPLLYTAGIFKGDDLLSLFEGFPFNVLGGFSSGLFRRADVQDFLPALIQSKPGFTAMVDLALYVCLLRRGNVAMLNTILSAERVHAERLSHLQEARILVPDELDLLVEMLKARSGEDAPAIGWARYVTLDNAAGGARDWQELALNRNLGNRQAIIPMRVGTSSDSFAEVYAQWLACRSMSAVQLKLLPDTLASWPIQPKIVPIIINDGNANAALNITLDSLAAQHYPPELVLVLSATCTEGGLDGHIFSLPLQDDGLAQINGILPQLDGADWFYLLRAGDRLIDTALLVLADRIVNNPQLQCLYSDEDALLDGESSQPVFKPDFNLDFLRSYPYIGRAMALRREPFLAAGGFAVEYATLAAHDALWRMIERADTDVVERVAEVLVSSQFSFLQWLALPELPTLNAEIVSNHLQRCGIEFSMQRGTLPLINRIDYLHAAHPLVSILIQHKDQLAALQRCVELLLEKTSYSHYEILIIDSGSTSADACTWLEGMARVGGDKVRVMYTPASENAAQLYNLGAQQARGEYLLMLTPYAVITQPQWLDALLNHAQRAEVGAVSGKWFNPDGVVIHAGLTLGLQGPAGLHFFGESARADGYMQRLQIDHDLSAVGTDCLIVHKPLFEQLGGMDEGFSELLWGVDLCLRIRRSGHLVVWTPYAQMVIGARPTPEDDLVRYQRQVEEQKAVYERWMPIIARDPAYNTNLKLTGSSFNLEPGLRSGWSPFTRHSLPFVLALPINTSAIGHYRVVQPFIELEAVGRIVGRITYELPPLHEIERHSPDVVVFQGRYGDGSVGEVESLKRYSNACRIFELDDYVIDVPKKNAHARGMPPETGRYMREAIALCDRVVVSTPALGDALSSMHHDIRVVPNMLAPQMWEHLRGKRRMAKKPRVGWGGGTSHTGDLEIIADVVRELADEVEWVFFGMCPDKLRPYVHEFHGSIPLASYPAKLASLNLDLAVAPLEFHLFNDCKSNLRLLEYGACGFPVVCTNTRAYQDFLPCTRVMSNSTEEWIQAIRMHLADPDASYRMGDQLREAVHRDFMLRGDNLHHWVHGWLED
ncbi:glycosyltransferase [Pseudomonas sp. Pseusp122]|uniref:glycosyltransferase n=1 Tax=unclassified Pseudomonas TaxID=196821 RepID=UPI0039A6C354